MSSNACACQWQDHPVLEHCSCGMAVITRHVFTITGQGSATNMSFVCFRHMPVMCTFFALGPLGNECVKQMNTTVIICSSSDAHKHTLVSCIRFVRQRCSPFSAHHCDKENEISVGKSTNWWYHWVIDRNTYDSILSSSATASTQWSMATQLLQCISLLTNHMLSRLVSYYSTAWIFSIEESMTLIFEYKSNAAASSIQPMSL